MSTNTINMTILVSYLLELNVLFLSTILVVILASYIIKPLANIEVTSKYIKLLAPSSFIGSFFIHLMVSYSYLYSFKWGETFTDMYEVELDTNLVYLQGGALSLDLFSLVLITLAYIVGFISLTSISDKSFWSNTKHPLIFTFFIIVVILFVTCDHLFTFFLYYEFLLIPSFFIVYLSSSNMKGVQASMYFLVWTQAGSTLVLAVVIQLIQIEGIDYFNQLSSLGLYSSCIEKIKFILFIGFGFKIPIWPLYYWLTKTHVEATGAFSMYLSGFLVKTALFGLYKFLLYMSWSYTNVLFITIALTGVIMSSLQMWAQVDLKKVVALCTVQEMNLLLICFLFGQTPLVYFGIMFCFMHAILSTLMFFLVDLIQKRFSTRLTTELSGIIHICPNLGVSIVLMCLCFLALPFTLKFTCEFVLFSGILDLSFVLILVLMLATNWVAPISFCRAWYGVIFGSPNSKHYTAHDLDFKDIIVIGLCISLLTLPCTILLGIV